MYNNDTTIVVSYLIYLLISVALTVWVARTLHKRGAIFLVDAFQGNAELAASVNHLLVVGFYLINIGFVTLALKSNATVTNSRAAIEMLSDKLGFVLITLGCDALLQPVCVLPHPRARTTQWPAASSGCARRSVESGYATVRFNGNPNDYAEAAWPFPIRPHTHEAWAGSASDKPMI